MRNVFEAALGELGVASVGQRWPDELRGVNRMRKALEAIQRNSSRVVDEMDDLRTRIIEEQAKSGALRDDNARLRDRISKIEGELIQARLRQRLEQMELPQADRMKVLECVK